MKVCAAFLTMLGLSVITPVPAQADDGARSSEAIALSVYGSADPQEAIAALSPTEVEAMAARIDSWTAVESASLTWKTKPTAAETAAMGGAVAQAAGGCWSQYKYYKWYDLWINTGDTWMTAHWCSNGSSITSYSLSNRGGQGYKGIAYQGLGGTYRSNVGWEVRQAQSFKFSVLWANANPCMQIRGGRTGLYSFRANCNLG